MGMRPGVTEDGSILTISLDTFKSVPDQSPLLGHPRTQRLRVGRCEVQPVINNLRPTTPYATVQVMGFITHHQTEEKTIH